jgi:putative ABC transport system substrate-binding protein
MISRRTFLATVASGVLLVPLAAGAQQAGKVWRIGYLSSQSAASAGRVSFDAFRQGLRDLGYFEGQNIVIESRWADGYYERLPTLAKELVSLNLDLIVSAGGDPTVRAVKAATTTVPIVFVTGSAVAAGIVSNLARPAANLTGFDLLAEELYTKQLALLKETLPKAVRVAVLWNPRIAGGEVRRKGLEIAAQALRVKLRFLEAQHPGEIETALAAIARDATTDAREDPIMGRRLSPDPSRQINHLSAGRGFGEGQAPSQLVCLSSHPPRLNPASRSRSVPLAGGYARGHGESGE